MIDAHVVIDELGANVECDLVDNPDDAITLGEIIVGIYPPSDVRGLSSLHIQGTREQLLAICRAVIHAITTEEFEHYQYVDVRRDWKAVYQANSDA